MIIKIALVALVLCVGVRSQRPSSAEFNLFCRIMRRADDLMYGPDYVYDENVDKEIIKEMTVLYNATTDDMKGFRQTLWVTKDFFEEHPPPTDARNRQAAHREIEKLIREGEKKIEENRGLAEKVHKKVEEAKLSVAQGLYGSHVDVVPKDDGNLTKILNNTKSIFNHETNASESCGANGKETGKTLLNDFFCVCVGEGDLSGGDGPCHGVFVAPKNGNGNGKWTQMKYDSSGNPLRSLVESIKKIEELCKGELLGGAKQTKDMDGLLTEYVGMIWEGKETGAKEKKIFGHSERKDRKQVAECTGTRGTQTGSGKEKYNEKLCVDYTKYQKGDKYDIPWHEKFKHYTNLMKEAKKLEDQILKNRAALLLLKSQAWVAYSREKDDETSNLDDMNVSTLFDGTRVPFHPPSLFLFYF